MGTIIKNNLPSFKSLKSKILFLKISIFYKKYDIKKVIIKWILFIIRGIILNNFWRKIHSAIKIPAPLSSIKQPWNQGCLNFLCWGKYKMLLGDNCPVLIKEFQGIRKWAFNWYTSSMMIKIIPSIFIYWWKSLDITEWIKQTFWSNEKDNTSTSVIYCSMSLPHTN